MVHDRIKRYIVENDVKQVDLAKAIGISKQLLSNKLRGECRITAEEYMSICDYLGVDYAKFAVQSDDRKSITK